MYVNARMYENVIMNVDMLEYPSACVRLHVSLEMELCACEYKCACVNPCVHENVRKGV